jgi:hypothetical protein
LVPTIAAGLSQDARNPGRELRHAPGFAVAARVISAVAGAAAAGEATGIIRGLRLCCCLNVSVLMECDCEHSALLFVKVYRAGMAVSAILAIRQIRSV